MIARNHVDHARWCLVPDGSNVKWREVAVKRTKPSPGCYGSVDGAPACKLKGCWFDSWSGHMPGLQARSGPQWGACKRQPHIDVPLPLFLPPVPSV